jgi:cell division septation protein DedD|tara:strand:- start:422 stop:874 length:453 start_codon:yes stop_codon:yes gene_type:complete
LKTERLIGLTVFLGIFISFIFVFYPNKDSSDSSNTILSVQNTEIPNLIEDSNVIPNELSPNERFKNFSESDFDFFVYRAHILSSKKNANNLKDKINNGGLPSFIEPFGDKKELFAVYVGPFLTEDDIVNNIKLIQDLSESKKGEISKWKL